LIASGEAGFAAYHGRPVSLPPGHESRRPFALQAG
jgi:hypothetical protein